MAKHPIKQSLIHRMIALIRRNPFTSIASLVTIFVGIPGAVAGYNYGVSLIEPVLPAHRYYVREVSSEHSDPILQRVIKVQLAQNDGRKKRLLNEIKQNELELQSDQAKQTPQYRSLVQQQIERTKSELDDIEKENKSLFKERTAK